MATEWLVFEDTFTNGDLSINWTKDPDHTLSSIVTACTDGVALPTGETHVARGRYQSGLQNNYDSFYKSFSGLYNRYFLLQGKHRFDNNAPIGDTFSPSGIHMMRWDASDTTNDWFPGLTLPTWFNISGHINGISTGQFHTEDLPDADHQWNDFAFYADTLLGAGRLKFWWKNNLEQDNTSEIHFGASKLDRWFFTSNWPDTPSGPADTYLAHVKFYSDKQTGLALPVISGSMVNNDPVAAVGSPDGGGGSAIIVPKLVIARRRLAS